MVIPASWYGDKSMVMERNCASDCTPYNSNPIPIDIEQFTVHFLDSLYSPFVSISWHRIHNGYEINVRLKVLFDILTVCSKNEKFCSDLEVVAGTILVAPRNQEELNHFTEEVRRHIKWLVAHEVDETLFVGNDRPWNPHK